MMGQKLMIVLSFMLMSFVLLPNKKRIKIYLIGDSTMCTYEPKQFPVTGWGMSFATFFDSALTIDNRARGGRSTKTFISENRWQPIVDSLQSGDYVFIQFGHNHEAKEPQYADRYTLVEDYKRNLIKFITEARSKKATPVLITPVTRMRFDKEVK